jgi:nitroreductase
VQIDQFIELVRKRRSIRKFKPDPIPDEYVEKILETARWAMSGANGQPWEFIVVKNQETINKIKESRVESRKESYIIEQTRAEGIRYPGLKYPPEPGFEGAPLAIVVLGDRRTYQASVMSTAFIGGETTIGSGYLKNMANATQNMCLAAAALGLGAQWASVNIMWAQPLKAILDVPPAIDIHTIVAVGYPAYEPGKPYRRELIEMIHYEKYDKSKYRSGEDIIKFVQHLRKLKKPGWG